MKEKANDDESSSVLEGFTLLIRGEAVIFLLLLLLLTPFDGGKSIEKEKNSVRGRRKVGSEKGKERTQRRESYI